MDSAKPIGDLSVLVMTHGATSHPTANRAIGPTRPHCRPRMHRYPMSRSPEKLSQ
jgi:hypothetical protein